MTFLRGRVCAAEVRLFTWEVVTGFDQEPAGGRLLQLFGEEFPEAAKAFQPRFWKMISFNAADGRLHRYLVALPAKAPSGGALPPVRKCGRRVLPQSIGVYGEGDRLVRETECGGNLRLAAVWKGALYVLVFMEGRLCHWSEEPGYDGECATALVRERLERFDEFLKTDALFSRAENYAKAVCLQGDLDKDWEALFKVAAQDPFWRRADLAEPDGTVRRSRHWRFAVSLATALSFALLFFDFGQNESASLLFEPAPPELSTPVVEKNHEPHAPREPAIVQPVLNVKNCEMPWFQVRGVVGGKLFLAQLGGGESRTLKLHDTLQDYVVERIDRDRVVLRCGDKTLEKESGR